MKEEILKRIDALATKLGVTSEHVWRILVQQARVEAISSIIWTIVSLLIFIGCVFGIKWVIKHTDDFENEDTVVGAGFACTIAGIISLILFWVNITSIITPLYNPEYWALHQIMEAIK